MALIIPHQSQQGIQTAQGGQTAQYRSASAFTTPGQENLGRGLQQLAQGMNKLGNTIHAITIQERQEQNTADVTKDMVELEGRSQAFIDDFMSQNKFADARGAAQAAQEYYDQERGVLLEK